MEFVGKRVKKHFKGFGWFEGEVLEAVTVRGKIYVRVGGHRLLYSTMGFVAPTSSPLVQYDDGDREDMPVKDVVKLLVDTLEDSALGAAQLNEKMELATKSDTSKETIGNNVQEVSMPPSTKSGDEPAKEVINTPWEGESCKSLLGAATPLLEGRNGFSKEPPTKKSVHTKIQRKAKQTHGPSRSIPFGSEAGGFGSECGDQQTHKSQSSSYDNVQDGAVGRKKASQVLGVDGQQASVVSEAKSRCHEITYASGLEKADGSEKNEKGLDYHLSSEPHEGSKPITKRWVSQGHKKLCEQIDPSFFECPANNLHAQIDMRADGDAPETSFMANGVTSPKPIRAVESIGPLNQTEASAAHKWKQGAGTHDERREEPMSLRSRTKRKKSTSEIKRNYAATETSAELEKVKSARVRTGALPSKMFIGGMKPWEADHQSTSAALMDSKRNLSQADGSAVAARNIDVRCPYALHIGFLEVGKHGPFALNWDTRPGVCSPGDNVDCQPCPIICKLLEKQMLRLGERVWWKGDRGRAIAVGWICKNGILCGRCGWVKDTHGFQTCAGINTDDAASFIQATCMISLGDLYAAEEDL